MPIDDDIAAIGVALNAAAPLMSASRATRYAMRDAARALVATIDARASSLDAAIDGRADIFGMTTVQVAESVVAAALEQARLVSQRGFMGRVAANLDRVAP